MISKFVEIGLIVQFEIVGMLRAFCGFISDMICAYFFNLIFFILLTELLWNYDNIINYSLKVENTYNKKYIQYADK